MTREHAVKQVMILRNEIRNQLDPGRHWAENDITERIVAAYVQAAAMLMVDGITVYPAQP